MARTTPTLETLRGVAEVAGAVRVVGDHGTLLSSDDGQTYALEPAPAARSLTSVLAAGDLELVAGWQGTVMVRRCGVQGTTAVEAETR